MKSARTDEMKTLDDVIAEVKKLKRQVAKLLNENTIAEEMEMERLELPARSHTKFKPNPRDVAAKMQIGDSVLVKSTPHRQALYNACRYFYGPSSMASRREPNGWRCYRIKNAEALQRRAGQ